MTDTTHQTPSGADRMFGDSAPALVGFTNNVLFGDVWKLTDLSRKAAMAVAKEVFRPNGPAGTEEH